MALDPSRAAVRLGVRRELARLDPGATVLVACSGGADSLALLAATVHEARAEALRVVGVVVDHGLQAGSAEHTAAVVEQMAGLGVDETASIAVTVDPGAGGIEAGAREARYVALGRLAEHFGADLTLLGHTRDDQAETVLLGLARGSGGRSVAGMRRTFEGFARPLLDVTRAQTESACLEDGITWWSDPHNADRGFARVRVREEVLPVLERELGPGIADALARTADQVREDVDLLDDSADLLAQELRDGEGWVAADVAELAPALRHRVLRLAALASGALGSDLTRGHVLALAALLTSPGKQVQLPGHVTAYVGSGSLRFRPTDA